MHGILKAPFDLLSLEAEYKLKVKNPFLIVEQVYLNLFYHFLFLLKQ